MSIGGEEGKGKMMLEAGQGTEINDVAQSQKFKQRKSTVSREQIVQRKKKDPGGSA